MQHKICLGKCVLLITSILLHRQNAELETLNANIQTEKEHLREQNTHLTQRLEAVAQPPTPVHGINADTPLDLMLNVLQKLIMVSNCSLTLYAPKLTVLHDEATGHAVFSGTCLLYCSCPHIKHTGHVLSLKFGASCGFLIIVIMYCILICHQLHGVWHRVKQLACHKYWIYAKF